MLRLFLCLLLSSPIYKSSYIFARQDLIIPVVQPDKDLLNLVHKLPELDQKLIRLLESLSEEEWHYPTVARLWTVKDVAAHLLDGNIRILSALRDGYQREAPGINSYDDLLAHLNWLNAEWVQAMKRISPAMLIHLHKHTGKDYYDYYASLDLYRTAPFPVAWAGEEESQNWMHFAREYTEKFLHQQQIRDATDRPGLLVGEFYHPFLSVCMLALPHSLRHTSAPEGTHITVHIDGEGGGRWTVVRSGDRWALTDGRDEVKATTEVTIDSAVAWKLFSKSVRATDIPDRITIYGDRKLGDAVTEMVSFMV